MIMLYEFLNVDGAVVTTVSTEEPDKEFEYFKAMLPQIVGYREYTEPPESLDAAKARLLAQAGAEFAKRRDAITWTQHDVGLYGYDRKSEDITNFLAAMQRASLGLDVGFNVYVDSADNPKQFLPHSFEMFKTVLEQSADEQVQAYLWYQEVKGQIQVAQSIDELNTLLAGGEGGSGNIKGGTGAAGPLFLKELGAM